MCLFTQHIQQEMRIGWFDKPMRSFIININNLKQTNKEPATLGQTLQDVERRQIKDFDTRSNYVNLK